MDNVTRDERKSTGRAARQRPQYVGSPADRLIGLWRKEDPRFEDVADDVLDAGRRGVLEVALRRLDPMEVGQFAEDLLILAQERVRPGDGPELVATALYVMAVEVESRPDGPPPVAALTAAMLSDGLVECLADTGVRDFRLLPVWLAPPALVALDPFARRALLNRLMGSEDEALRYVTEAGLIPDTGFTGGMLAVVGTVEQILDAADDDAADDDDDDDQGEDEGDDDDEGGEAEPADEDGDQQDEAVLARLDALEAQAASRFEAMIQDLSRTITAVEPLVRRCEPVGGLEELRDFLRDIEDAGPDELDELSDFLAVAVDETADGALVAEVAEAPEGLHVRLFDTAGTLLDERAFILPEPQRDDARALLDERCRTVRQAGSIPG
jgi:hypothetical protein